MDIGTMSLAGAFLVGLAHVFQPCEDKAIVAAFVMGAARKVASAVRAVVFYGLGITLVNTCLGFVFSCAGSALIEMYETPLKITAGLVTITFGLYSNDVAVMGNAASSLANLEHGYINGFSQALKRQCFIGVTGVSQRLIFVCHQDIDEIINNAS